MADKGGTKQVVTAAAVAAGSMAAQLGVGYGLGIVTWPSSAVGTTDTGWLISLAWTTWIAAGSIIFGAVTASRLTTGAADPAPHEDQPRPRSAGPRCLWRLVLASCAAMGALPTVALIAVPARSVVLGDTLSPQSIAAGYAILGIIAGGIVSYWAVASRPMAANVLITAALLWTLAVSAVVRALITRMPGTGAPLGGWQVLGPGFGSRFGTLYWPDALLSVVTAFAIGAVAVVSAVRRGDRGIGAAASGAIGPLLLAIAFLGLTPQLTGAADRLESAYLIAPYTVLAGLAGSALVVGIARRAGAARAGAAEVPGPREYPTERTGSGTAQQPTQRRTSAATVTEPPAVPIVASINPPLSVPRTATSANAPRATESSATWHSDPASADESTSAVRPAPLGATASASGVKANRATAERATTSKAAPASSTNSRKAARTTRTTASTAASGAPGAGGSSEPIRPEAGTTPAGTTPAGTTETASTRTGLPPLWVDDSDSTPYR